MRDGIDGRVVPAGDPARLRRLLAELFEDESQAGRLGSAARETVVRERTIERFVSRVCDWLASHGGG